MLNQNIDEDTLDKVDITNIFTEFSEHRLCLNKLVTVLTLVSVVIIILCIHM